MGMRPVLFAAALKISYAQQVCDSTYSILQQGALAAIQTCEDFKGDKNYGLSGYVNDCKNGYYNAGNAAGSSYFESQYGCVCKYTTSKWKNDGVDSAYLTWCNSNSPAPELQRSSRLPRAVVDYFTACNVSQATCTQANPTQQCLMFQSAAQAGYQTCNVAVDQTSNGGNIPGGGSTIGVCKNMLIDGGSTGVYQVEKDNACCCSNVQTKNSEIFALAPSEGTSWCKTGVDHKTLANLLVIKKINKARALVKFLVFRKLKSKNGKFTIFDYLVWKKLFNKSRLKTYFLLHLFEN